MGRRHNDSGRGVVGMVGAQQPLRQLQAQQHGLILQPLCSCPIARGHRGHRGQHCSPCPGHPQGDSAHGAVGEGLPWGGAAVAALVGARIAAAAQRGGAVGVPPGGRGAPGGREKRLCLRPSG